MDASSDAGHSGPLGALRCQLDTWLTALDLQEGRVAAPYGVEMDQRIAEAQLFAISLRLVCRACQAIAALTQSPDLDRAIKAFNRRVPAVVAIRDVIEHFDDYAIGIGKLGAGVRSPTHSHTAGTSTYYVMVHDFSAGSLINVHELDVRDAAQAARELAAAAVA
jgi:hypothetical protein